MNRHEVPERLTLIDSAPGSAHDHTAEGTAPRVGRVSQFLGSRLLMIGLLAGSLGLGLLAFAGIELWLAVTRERFGANLVVTVVSGGLAVSLLSIAGSAWKTGLTYLHGERAISTNFARSLGRRLARHRSARRR